MPLERALFGDRSKLATCCGLLDGKGRTAWTLTGDAAVLHRTAAIAPTPVDLGSILWLFDGLLENAGDLDGVAFISQDFEPTGAFNSWLDAVCRAAMPGLVKSNGWPSRAKAAIEAGAKKAAAAGEISAVFSIDSACFQPLETLWLAAAAQESDPAEAMATKWLPMPKKYEALAEALTMDMLVADKGGANAVQWTEVELLYGGRLDRAVAAKEVTFFFKQLGGVAFEGLLEGDEVRPEFMTDKEAVASCLEELAARRPPRELRSPPSSLLQAKRSLVDALRMPRGAAHVLNLGNIQGAVGHFDVLAALCGNAEPAEVWSSLESIALRLKLPETRPSLPLLPLVAARLDDMQERFESEAEKPLQTKLLALLAILGQREDAKADGGSGEKGKVGEGDGMGNGKPSSKVGYPRYYQAALEAVIDRQAYINVTVKVENSLEELRLGTCHPHDTLRVTLEGGQMPHLHGLFGIKEEVATLPTVKKIADALPQHGARFLGYLGMTLLMPAGMADEDVDDGEYPSLKALWEAWSSGNFAINLEELYLNATVNFYGGEEGDKLFTSEAEMYKDQLSLQRLRAGIVEPHRLFGFTEEPSFATAITDAINYMAESTTVPFALRKERCQAFLTGLDAEQTVVSTRMLKSGDPGAVWKGRSYETPGSPTRIVFNNHRRKGVKTYALKKMLTEMGYEPKKGSAAGASESSSMTDAAKKAADGQAAAAKAAEKTAVEKAAAAAAAEKAEKAEAKKAEAAKKKDQKELESIGMYADRIVEDVAADKIFVKNGEGKVLDTLPRQKTLDNLPPGGCLGAHVVTSKVWWRYCTCPPTAPPEEKARHSTLRMGAHAVGDWRQRMASILVFAAMAQGGSGTVISSVPPKAAAAPVMPRAFGSVSLSTMTLPVGQDGHAFVPMRRVGSMLEVGVPAQPSSVFGCLRQHVGREEDHRQSIRWSEKLFATSVHAFYLFETEHEPKVVVSCSILPEGESPKAESEAAIVWQSIKEVGASAEVDGGWGCYALLAIAVARAGEFTAPSAGLPTGVLTGAMPERFVNPQRVLKAAEKDERRRVPWSEVKARSEATMQRIAARLEAKLEEDLSAERKEDIATWLQVARRPLALGDFAEGLSEHCFDANDDELAHVPLPNTTQQVATAPRGPLPPPPPPNAIPAHAKDWDDVLMPEPYAKAVEAQASIYRSLCSMAVEAAAHGEEAEPKPVEAKFFACGADSCYPWARALVKAGEVIIKTADGLELMDRSQSPAFTLCPEYWREVLGDGSQPHHSTDRALYDALTWRGVDFHADEALDAQLVFMTPQKELVKGFASVHESAAKMAKPGWFKIEKAAGVESGRLDISMFPERYQKLTCVPRKHSDVWRLCVNNSDPPPGSACFTTTGKKEPVISLNEATGTRLSRAAMKAARGVLLKENTGTSVGIGKAVQTPAQPGKWLSAAAAAAIKEEHGIDPSIRAGDPGGPVLPPELKAYFYELMIATCLFAHYGALLGMEVACFGDDMAKMFHQLAIALLQVRTCGQMMLDPEDVAKLMAGKLPADVLPALAKISERCVSMGTTPSSSYCQRAMTEHCRDVEKRSVPLLADKVAELRAGNVKFDACMRAREQLSVQTGEDETRMLWLRCFTDDPVGVTLECFLPDCLVLWGDRCDAARFMRGDATKRTLGVQIDWVGGKVLTVGLLAAVPRDKAMRLAGALALALKGELTVKQFHALAGLMQHVVYMLALPKYILYDFYHGLDHLRKELKEEPTDEMKVPATKTARRAYSRARQAVLTRGGSSLLSAILEVAPAKGVMRWRPHSDAALEGVGEPAICGNLYGRAYVLVLTESFKRWPIVALEFAGQGPLNLLAFGESLLDVDGFVVLPGDSLVAPRVLSGGARRSPLLRHMHELFMELPIFQKLEHKLVCSQEYGVGNPLTDAGSRGKKEVMRAVARSLGLSLEIEKLPSAAMAYMMAVDRHLDELLRTGEYWLNAAASTGKHATGQQLKNAAQPVAASDFSMAELLHLSFACMQLACNSAARLLLACCSPAAGLLPGYKLHAFARVCSLLMVLAAAFGAAGSGGGDDDGGDDSVGGDDPDDPGMPAAYVGGGDGGDGDDEDGGGGADDGDGGDGGDEGDDDEGGNDDLEPDDVEDPEPQICETCGGVIDDAFYNGTCTCSVTTPVTAHLRTRHRSGFGYLSTVLLLLTFVPVAVAGPTRPQFKPTAPGLLEGAARPAAVAAAARPRMTAAPLLAAGPVLAPSEVRMPPLPRRAAPASATTMLPAHAVAARPAAVQRPAVPRPMVMPTRVGRGAMAPPASKVQTDHTGRDGEVALAGWAEALVSDTSSLAIMPGRQEELQGLLDEMSEYLELAYADSTNKTDKYHLKAWQLACQDLGTPWLRFDMAANTGADPVGYRRELLLPALAYLKMYWRMKPRSKKDKAPHPRSCLLKLYAVAREHVKRGYKMAPFTLAVKVMAGMLHHYVLTHGTDALMPHRKNPLTNLMILQMLQVPEGACDAPDAKGRCALVVRWQSDFWVGVSATISVLAETGMRKADVSKATKATPFKRGRLTLASVRWRVSGDTTAAPTVAQMARLGDDEGDGCWLVFGAMKNDAYGEHFGAKPAWLPYSATAARNACRALAALERRAAQAGIGPDRRGVTPLFGPSVGVEWHHSELEAVFDFLLEHGCGLNAEERHAYSLHSFRIYLACALYAAGCPNDKICAILRWRSEDALLIYARMNDPERTDWVSAAMQQKVESTTTAHLPRLDPDDYIAALQQAIDDGELGRVAQQADVGAVDEKELDEALAEDEGDHLVRARDVARQAARAITARLDALATAAAAPAATATAAPAAAPTTAAVTWAEVLATTTPVGAAVGLSSSPAMPDTPARPARPEAARTPGSVGLASLARQLTLGK